MRKKKLLLSFQIFAFIGVSLIAAVWGYYFPNMPPVVRAVLPRGLKDIIQVGNSGSPDKRFLEWFNRDPERIIPKEPNILVSPADGIVWDIRSNQTMKHIVIEMRYTDIHVQRFPIGGEVTAIEGEGKKLNAGTLVKEYMLEKMLPFQKVTTLKTDIGTVRIRQITSFFANRIEVFVAVGQQVERGERLGRVIAGSTIVLEVPEEVSIIVKKNQNVLAGETIIGTYLGR